MFGSEPSHSAKIALENFKKNNKDLNLNYYPKLIGMSPYSPISGYEFLYKENKNKIEITNSLIKHIDDFALKNNILSCNFLYVNEDWGKHLKSLGYQEWINTSSEWKNNGEKTFDDFLSRFNSNQRKNIKKERKSILKQKDLIQTTGIGISKAKNIKWRWYLKNSRSVSKRLKGDRTPKFK